VFHYETQEVMLWEQALQVPMRFARSKLLGRASETCPARRWQGRDIVLDKLSINIVFAIVGFGGFLGMGEKYHPIPWSSLKYDEREGGYAVPFSREMLEAAPADSMEALIAGNAMAYRDRAYDYYHARVTG